MAKRLDEPPCVGDLCYCPFDIQKPGKVIDVDTTPQANRTYNIKVRWLADGSITEENTLYLNDYNHVVNEYQRKFLKMDLVRVDLKKL